MVWDIFDLRFSKFREADEVVLSDIVSRKDLLWLVIKKNEIIKSERKLLRVIETKPTGTVQITEETKIKNREE